jgi:RimJ/RimL family protein N-acetyltransferase
MVIAEARRLFLRCFHVADLDAMAEVFGDPEVMRFGPGPQTRDWVQTWLWGCLQDYYCKWGFGLWAVVHRPDLRVIGFCGLTRFDDIDGQVEIEIGYRLARSYWGRGLASEAAAAVRDYALGVLALPRLVAIIDPRNVASIRVAEKTGLRYEKEVLLRSNLRHLYVIHQADLRARSPLSQSDEEASGERH